MALTQVQRCPISKAPSAYGRYQVTFHLCQPQGRWGPQQRGLRWAGLSSWVKHLSQYSTQTLEYLSRTGT